MNKNKLFDVIFNVSSSIVIEANNEEEAENEFNSLSDEEIAERVIESIKTGGLHVETIERINQD